MSNYQNNSYYKNIKTKYLYAISGKSKVECQKTIERYDIEKDQWVEVKMQLVYARALSSAITFNNRYIYVVGGSTSTDCFEIIDTYKED